METSWKRKTEAKQEKKSPTFVLIFFLLTATGVLLAMSPREKTASYVVLIVTEENVDIHKAGFYEKLDQIKEDIEIPGGNWRVALKSTKEISNLCSGNTEATEEARALLLAESSTLRLKLASICHSHKKQFQILDSSLENYSRGQYKKLNKKIKI